MLSIKTLIIFLGLFNVICCGPIGVGICYAGCAGLVVACFGAAGAVFGTVPGAVIAASPALTACNAAFGSCMSMCTVAIVAPTP